MDSDISQPMPLVQSAHQWEPVQRTKRSRTWLLILIGIIVMMSVGSTGYLLLTAKSKPVQKNPPQKSNTISPTQRKVTAGDTTKIVARKYVTNQKNLFASEGVSSGFLNHTLLSKQQVKSDSLLVHKAQASEIELSHLFLFYVKDHKQIKTYDISDGIEYELLDIRDITGIAQIDKASIHEMRFLNTTKKIVFTLVERLDNNPDDEETLKKNISQYKMSLNTYDVKTKELKKLIEITGKVGESMYWENFAVSPDERYIFALYKNVFDNPDFATISSVFDPQYNKEVYVFYDLSEGSLHTYKLGNRSQGINGVQWDDSSESILFRYNNQIDSQTVINFNRIYPDGQNAILWQKVIDREFSKSQYITSLSKIFYVSTGSNKNYDSFHNEIFGYLDVATNEITDITQSDQYTTQFAYDYTGGVFYNTITRSNGSVTSMILNHYDIATKQSKVLAENRAIIINFNGDYEHLLIGVQNIPNTDLYDLNTVTGEQTFLNTVPTIISVY